MKVLKDNSSSENNAPNNKYGLILTTSHSISDGRNGYPLYIQYLNILIDILKNSPTIYEVETVTTDELINKLKSISNFKILKEDIGYSNNSYRIPQTV